MVVRYVSVIRRRIATWASAAPYARSVGSPATTSVNRCARRPRADQRRARCAADMRPTRTMNTGISGTVSATVSAATTSTANRQTTTASGTIAASASCGR